MTVSRGRDRSLRAAPRTDPYVKDSLIRLLPRVHLTASRSLGYGCYPCLQLVVRTTNPVTRIPGSASGTSALVCVPLGRPPSLCGLRCQRFRADFVRPLRWYYEAVRLPADVHVDIAAFSLLRPSHTGWQCGRLQGLPVPAHGASPHA